VGSQAEVAGAAAPAGRPAIAARDAPLRRLGRVELFGAGAAFVAPAFSLGAIFAVLAVSGGRYAWAGVILGTLAVLLTGYCFASMSERHPRAGGAYALVSSELTLPVGFVAGWSLGILYLLGPAVPLLLAVGILGTFLPAAHAAPVAAAALVSAAVFALNALGLRPSSRVALAVFAAEAAILVGIALALFAHPAAALPPPPSGSLATLVALGGSGGAAVFLFLGFESVTAYSEEARRPARDIAWGTMATVLATSLVYVVSALAYLHAIPLSTWSEPGASLPSAVGGVLGPAGSTLASAVILVSSVGAMICVQNAGARVLFAMGRDRVLPAPLARLFGRERSPWPALALSTALTFGLVAWSLLPLGGLGAPASFLTVLLPELLVVGALVAYALLSLAYVAALVRDGSARSAPARLAPPVASLAVTSALLALQLLPGAPGGPAVPIGALVWLAIGFAVWGLTWIAARSRPSSVGADAAGGA
jgi:amino acid transporter